MDLRQVLTNQDGVVSRRQVLACGHNDDFIEQRLRRKDWARIHRGVYVNHTGPVTWIQRLWAALLFAWPAAADAESAMALHGLRVAGPLDDVHVAIADDRRVRAPAGVRIRTLRRLAAELQPNRTPPRLRLETAVLRVASNATSEADMVAALSDAIRSRRTIPERLATTLKRLDRLPRHAFLVRLLDDVANGAHSVLEHRYLARVERAHGLPRGRRQQRVTHQHRTAYRDVDYLGGALVVELDGGLGHDEIEDRWADLERDVDTAISGSTTIRIGWQQVMSPCRVAVVVARLLRHLGWQGQLTSCREGCTAVALDVSA